MSNYYLIGGELNAITAFDPTLGSGRVVDSPGFDLQQPSGEVRGAIDMTNSGSTHVYMDMAYTDPATGAFLTSANGLVTFWSTFTFEYFGSDNATVCEWHDASGTAWLRIEAFAGGATDYHNSLQYWNGTTWIDTGLYILTNYGSPQRIDMLVTGGSGGGFQFFANNYLVGNFAVDLSGIGKIVSQRFFSLSSEVGYNNIIVSDTSTREHNIRYRTASGAGAEQTWTGDYTNVSEYPETQSNPLFTGTAGNGETFVHPTFADQAPGKIIKAVAVAAYMRRDSAGGPQNAKMRLRISNVDYDKPVAQPDISYTGRTAIWLTDPATGLAWGSITDVNGEFGILSVA